ncbi:MAG: Chorismate synthase [Planctomycetota bacterium]|jgi:chorismate synthase
MSTLRYWTAGESHGKALVALVDGFPAGVTIDTSGIDAELRRRQGGYGRGGRQRIETDRVEVLTGVWQQTTLGSPIALQVINKDYKLERLTELARPRPGHGDLTGAIKYLGSIRGVLERASARETTVRVAAGALAKQLLTIFGIETFGYVVELGGVAIPAVSGTLAEQRAIRDQSSIYSLNPQIDSEVERRIDEAGKAGDTLGGIVEVRVEGLPFGLGTHAQWDQKLDGRLAQAVMAVQAIKGIEIGLGFEAARRRGSQVHDPIQFDASRSHESHLGYVRPTNNAGGLEAGMTNGQPLVVRAAMKPISTLAQPLESINLETKQPEAASYERSDVCAVSAASVIVENVVAFEMARALVEKFGGDSVLEMKARWAGFMELARGR